MPLYGSNFVSLISNQIINGIKNFTQNLGLGINNPQAKLHIDGGNAAASSIKFTAGNTTGQSATDGFTIGISSNGNAEIRQFENAAISLQTNDIERINLASDGRIIVANGSRLFVNNTTASNSSATGALIISGGVGVGNNLFVAGLISANGNIGASGLISSANSMVSPQYRGISASGTNTIASDLFIQGGVSTGNATPSNVIFSTTNAGVSGTTLQSATEKMRLSGAGNLLLGTTTDNGTDRLQVNGSVGITGNTITLPVSDSNGILFSSNYRIGIDNTRQLTIANNDSNSSAAIRMMMGAATILFINQSGRLLIGTTTDNGIDKLQIAGSINASISANSTVFNVSQNTGGSTRSLSLGSNGVICTNTLTVGATTPSGLGFFEIYNNSPTRVVALIRGVASQTADLQQWRNSAATVLASVDANGIITAPQFRLSVNNTAPASATDTGVAGEIRIDSNFIYYCVAVNQWKRVPLSSW